MASPDRFLLAAVMGWPIAQSRSPALHNFWFAQHGLAGSYVPMAITAMRHPSMRRGPRVRRYHGRATARLYAR